MRSTSRYIQPHTDLTTRNPGEGAKPEQLEQLELTTFSQSTTKSDKKKSDKIGIETYKGVPKRRKCHSNRGDSCCMRPLQKILNCHSRTSLQILPNLLVFIYFQNFQLSSINFTQTKDMAHPHRIGAV